MCDIFHWCVFRRTLSGKPLDAYFCCAFADANVLFSVGSNDQCQLGLGAGDKAQYNTMTKVKGLPLNPLRSAAAGLYHSVVVGGWLPFLTARSQICVELTSAAWRQIKYPDPMVLFGQLAKI